MSDTNETTNADQPPAARARRAKMRRVLARLIWICCVAAVGVLVFSYVIPQDLRRTGRLYTPAITLAFFGRTFTFHLGVALLAAAVVALVVLRHRRLGLFAFAAASVALAPTAWSFVPKEPPPPAP